MSRPDDHTLKFVLKRKMISRDREGRRFAFWFETDYFNLDVGRIASCTDYVPDQVDPNASWVFRARF